MSQPGNPWDDALAESFFKTLKRELMNDKGYKTRGGGETGRIQVELSVFWSLGLKVFQLLPTVVDDEPAPKSCL